MLARVVVPGGPQRQVEVDPHAPLGCQTAKLALFTRHPQGPLFDPPGSGQGPNHERLDSRLRTTAVKLADENATQADP